MESSPSGCSTKVPTTHGGPASRDQAQLSRPLGGLGTVHYGAFIVSPLTIGLLAQATSLRLALALLVVTSLAIAGLATRWPTASTPPC